MSLEKAEAEEVLEDVLDVSWQLTLAKVIVIKAASNPPHCKEMGTPV